MNVTTDKSPIDKFTLVHALTGYFIGSDTKLNLDEALGGAVVFELVENTIIADHTEVNTESLSNAIVDVVIFGIMFRIGRSRNNPTV